jgi:hypothetical protein
VFTARYALSPYIKQVRFVFKGLKSGKHFALMYITCSAHVILLVIGEEYNMFPILFREKRDTKSYHLIVYYAHSSVPAFSFIRLALDAYHLSNLESSIM